MIQSYFATNPKQILRYIYFLFHLENLYTYNIYIMTPNDHMSHDLSYFSGPSTSGAVKDKIDTKHHVSLVTS